MWDERQAGEQDVPVTERFSRAWVESLNVAFELAIAGAKARYGMSRDEAIGWLDQIFREEDERDWPSKLRMARGIADAGQ